MAGIDDYVSNIVLKVVRRLLLTGGLAISVAGALPSSIAPNPVKVRAVHTRADVVAVDTLCRLVGLKGDDQVFEEVMPCAEVVHVRRQAGVRYSSKQLEYATLDYRDFDGLAHTAKVATFVLDGQAKAGSSIVVAYDADRPDVVVPTSAKPGILSWLAPVGLIVGPVLLAIWWFLRDGLPAGVPRRPKQGGAALTDDVEMGLPVRNAETERTILVLGKRTAGERPLTTVRPLVVAPAQVWASKEKAAESVRVTRVVPAGPQAAAERMARVVKRVGETGAQLPAMVVVEGQSKADTSSHHRLHDTWILTTVQTR